MYHSKPKRGKKNITELMSSLRINPPPSRTSLERGESNVLFFLKMFQWMCCCDKWWRFHTWDGAFRSCQSFSHPGEHGADTFYSLSIIIIHNNWVQASNIRTSLNVTMLLFLLIPCPYLSKDRKKEKTPPLFNLWHSTKHRQSLWWALSLDPWDETGT